MEKLAAVRPCNIQSLPASTWRQLRAAILIPLLAIGLIILCIALMAEKNGAHRQPRSMAIDSIALKHLTRDKTDFGDYPSWAKDISQLNHESESKHGLWTYYKGPPFLQRVTLYAGNDVDLTRAGELVRRILDLPLNFGKWEGNQYLTNFETQQMHFLQSNEHSAIVIPPLSEHNTPLLSDHAKEMLHRYISVGHNMILVLGGPAAVDFVNKNLLLEGMRTLEPAWTRGPYEKLESTMGTPFQPLPVSLPNMMNHVHGVRKESLPLDAVSYYETQGISVVFSLPFMEGKVMFIGFDYSDMSKPWIKTLMAGIQFAD